MLHTMEQALADLRLGKIVIVVDDENRENEGDFLMAAEKVSPEAINFMITHGRGLVCMPMRGEDLDRLQLPPMVQDNTDPHQTAFTVSVDHIETTTGISAYERALTIQKMIDGGSQPEDFKRPGHIFPLRAKAGGVLEREGHTEAAVDLARLAGLYPAGVICEIIQEDGTMARLPRLLELAEDWDLKVISIADLIAYRKKQECPIQRVAQVNMPTEHGEFTMYAYAAPDSAEPHLALVKGNLADGVEPVLVRVHSECMTGDVFGSERCDCGKQLARSLENINAIGTGVLLYLRQEGRGIGLVNKLKAYELQEQGFDTVDANVQLGFAPELRDFGVGAAILQDLGVRCIRLMTNNPLKIEALRQHGIEVVSREAVEIPPTCSNVGYLKTKAERMGHMLQKSTISQTRS